MIDRKMKYIFIHIPKTAGVSIYHALGKTDEQNHKTRWDYEEDYFSFAFVRNPWDRLASAYHYMCKGGRGYKGDLYAQGVISKYGSFDEFVRNLAHVQEELGRFAATGNGNYIRGYPHLLSQHLWTHRDDRKVIDFIGRFETLNEDIEEVGRRIGKRLRLKRMNTTERTAYQGMYSDEGVELVREYYGEDIQLFGYDF